MNEQHLQCNATELKRLRLKAYQIIFANANVASNKRRTEDVISRCKSIWYNHYRFNHFNKSFPLFGRAVERMNRQEIDHKTNCVRARCTKHLMGTQISGHRFAFESNTINERTVR